MYKKFYGLRENPFNLTPDPDFVFLGRVHKKALAYLTYGLDAGKGFVQLTGEIGSGKTTLLKTLLMKNRNKIKSAFIVNPKATFMELFRMMLYQLSIIELESVYSKEVLLSKFHSFLLEQAKQNCPVIIVIDEAQNLDKTVLEEIRMLSNLETGKQKLVQIIFVGQPELKEIFLLPELKQLKQRIAVAFHIYPLDRDDTTAYINHRMKIVGSSNNSIFTQCACDEIYSYSSGIPRLINIICDAALLAGYVEERKAIDGALIKEVINDLIEDLGNRTQESEITPVANL